MPETEHSQKNLDAIRTRLDQIESMQRLIVAANKDVQAHVRQVLEGRENAPEIVLLLAEGPLLQEDIMARLSKSQPTVSKVLGHLHDCGLLVKYGDPENPRKVRWGLNDLETTVNVVRTARRLVGGGAKSSTGGSSNGFASVSNR